MGSASKHTVLSSFWSICQAPRGKLHESAAPWPKCENSLARLLMRRPSGLGKRRRSRECKHLISLRKSNYFPLHGPARHDPSAPPRLGWRLSIRFRLPSSRPGRPRAPAFCVQAHALIPTYPSSLQRRRTHPAKTLFSASSAPPVPMHACPRQRGRSGPPRRRALHPGVGPGHWGSGGSAASLNQHASWTVNCALRAA